SDWSSDVCSSDLYDTIKGGDFRSREANVYRMAEVSASIIDQCVAQGVPFAREYGGLLANRSFGGVQVSRTFYARGQTGQQLLLGAYQALARQIGIGAVGMHARHEMLDLVVIDGRARGIIVRDLVSGAVSAHTGDAGPPHQIPEEERDYYLERLYPSYGNLAPRDIASRRAKEVCDAGRGVGPGGHGVYLDFRDAIARLGRGVIAERYGNLFEMYQR